MERGSLVSLVGLRGRSNLKRYPRGRPTTLAARRHKYLWKADASFSRNCDASLLGMAMGSMLRRSIRIKTGSTGLANGQRLAADGNVLTHPSQDKTTGLLHYENIPAWQQENEFVLSGYRQVLSFQLVLFDILTADADLHQAHWQGRSMA